MKKQKLSLQELKVESFVTNIENREDVNGGATPIISISVIISMLTFPNQAGSSLEVPAPPPPKPPKGGDTIFEITVEIEVPLF